MSGSFTFTYEELVVMPEGGDDPYPLTVDMELSCTTNSEAPSGQCGPPEFYDPGCGPEFELDSVAVNNFRMMTGDFERVYGSKLSDMIWELAQEAATESGEF